jgi:hypothetical protein
VLALIIIIGGLGYVGGFLLSSCLLRRILLFVDPSLREITQPNLDFRDVGLWIGACEYFLIVTFVLVDAYVAIGLIFAAKEIVRSEKIRERPSYYLLGTLLNTAFAVLFGVLIKSALPLVG